MGTVMGWVDKKGVKHQTLVLDASYRNVLRWSSSTSTLPSNLVGNGGTGQYFGVTGINTFTSYGSHGYHNTAGASTTDSSYNNKSQSDDLKTCKENTSVLLSYFGSSTNNPAGWCRSKIVTHNNTSHKCDVPVIQIADRINLSCIMFDSLDPTTVTSSNKGLFLTKNKTGQSYNCYYNFNGISTANISTCSRVGTTNNIYYSEYNHLHGYGSPTEWSCSIPVLELENL